MLESISRNKKTLKQAHQRTEAKTICMLEEIQEEEEEAERSRKRKRSASDSNVPEPARSLDNIAFDDLLAWPNRVPYPN